ncbi:MAG: hypothetical protein AABY06_03055 [Nanoarchaeota archaeon]
MSKAKDLLKFIYTPKEIYAVLDKFGYKPGNSLIKAVIQKGYAEEREHKIVLTKLGKIRLNEIESSENNSPEIQPQLIEQIITPAKEYKNNSSLWFLGVVGLLGLIISIWQVSSSKIFMPYGIIGIFFLISLIFSIILSVRNSK